MTVIHSDLHVLKVIIFLVSLAQPSFNVSAGERAYTVASVLVDTTALIRPHDVELQDNLAFVPGKGGTLAIIDVADPHNPRILWSTRGGAHMEDAETVYPMGNYLFLGTKDFLSLDITNPYQPEILKIISDRPRIDKINGMVRRGHHIIAAGKAGWISLFDIGDPRSPEYLGVYNANERDNMINPHDIDLAGSHEEYILVVDPAGFGMRGLPGKVAIYQIADAPDYRTLPVEQWKLIAKIEGYDLNGVNRIDVFGTYACITGGQRDIKSNIIVVDFSTPHQLKRSSMIPFPDMRGPNGLTVAGKVAFAAGAQTIAAIDLSDPRQISILAVIKSLEIFPDGRDNAHDLVYRDGYLYVTGQNSYSFGILKINDEKILWLASDTAY